MNPSFLPPMLDMDGAWEDVLSKLYSIFESDFKKTKACHRGRRVIYDGRILDDGGKEEGFWHVISKDDPRTGERLPDYERARRLPWAKPMMESPAHQEIALFEYNEGPRDKGLRRYLWLKNYDYVVILQTRKAAYYWVTAFYVDSSRKKKFLARAYDEWLKTAAAAPKDGP